MRASAKSARIAATATPKARNPLQIERTAHKVQAEQERKRLTFSPNVDRTRIQEKRSGQR
jgi:hypothetical protein